MTDRGTQKVSRPRVLDQQALIPLGLVLALVVAVLSAHSYLESRFRGLETLLESLDRRLERVEEAQREGLRLEAFRLWVSEFGRLNPGINIPSSVHDPDRDRSRGG